jgi:HPt (histidine-containing phosphotransfer) domain-containing protein
MKAAVDLAAFHELTGGDVSLERKLFKDFLISSMGCLHAMQKNWSKGTELAWQQQAHALKGICLNLGADRLGKLCKQAQDSSTAEPTKKLELLQAIQNELESVKRYLDKI